MWKKSILLEWNIFSYCLILRLTLRKKSSPDLPKIVIGSWQCLLNPSLGNCLKGIIRRVIFHALISSSSFEKSLKLLFFLLLLKILCRMLSRLRSHKLFFRKICTMDHFLIGLAPLIVSKLDQFHFSNSYFLENVAPIILFLRFCHSHSFPAKELMNARHFWLGN